MLTHLRLDNIGGVGLGVGLSYVLALLVNTHSLVSCYHILYIYNEQAEDINN